MNIVLNVATVVMIVYSFWLFMYSFVQLHKPPAERDAGSTERASLDLAVTSLIALTLMAVLGAHLS